VTWFLDVRAQSVGGGVARDVVVYRQDVLVDASILQEATRNRDIIFVTHGFNVNREDGRIRLGNWESLLSLPSNAVYVAMLWPGDSAWIPAIDYPIEGNEAIASGNLLASFILSYLRSSATLSFASHSLGARVILQTIRGIKTIAPVRRIMLMAGAIDDTCLEGEYSDAAANVSEISVLASYHDEVLALAFPLGNFVAGLITRDCPYWHAALGREGPQSTLGGKVKPGWQIPNPWDYGHHNYLPTLSTAKSLAPPQDVPPLTTGVPTWANFNQWRAAWSAGVFSTRYE
jgi:hypothetical protein